MLSAPSGHNANQTGPRYGHANDNDEIDLFELLFRLWDKKGLIVMVTLVTMLIASIYAFTASKNSGRLKPMYPHSK
ncbi:Wzz/FepE/Etk N-terminal domain-containing protein [Budvicia aquatica]|uniref:Wzz/FepE/Etk N-terminal domain-containing protein n=1 Tax=Budvicia aquatica TaxID=82979 RepID=UPI0020889E27|nr:Wzz/FepE/Etk N-terminal domain-containing protein [Budvicia aquatica]GKX52789.1 hypothetical protein SOASR029_30980 [Budvicia aquatica]